MRFLAIAALTVGGMASGVSPAAAQSHSGWTQPSFAQAQADLAGAREQLNTLEQNLRLAAQIRRGVYLGVQLSDIDADRAKALHMDEERGVQIEKVEPGSPAENAGLRAGDVLLSYNGENILGARQLGRLVEETPSGRKVRIQYWRDGKTQSTVAIIAELSVRRLPADLDIQVPDIHIAIPDIPTPVVVWKSPALGIECESLDSQLADYFGVKRGVLVRSVEKGSAAEKAGLRAGDVLTAVDNRPVASAHDVVSCLRTERRAGRSIALALVREHRQLTFNVVPDSGSQE
jgi:serine protease Do